MSVSSNPLLKDLNEKVEFTREMVEEYARCAMDPIYFIKNYVLYNIFKI